MERSIQVGSPPVEITHPEKRLYPESRITKGDVAAYYERVARWALPEMAHRPLVLVRCPNGWSKQCFFQKHPQKNVTIGVPTVKIRENNGVEDYLYIERPEHLLSLVQMNVLEIHSWQCRVGDLKHPDRMVFDLDPGPNASVADVIDAALLLQSLFERYDLESYVQTTGGKGLHVVVPLTPIHEWETVKQFTRSVATALAASQPTKFVATMSKQKRRGRVFVDYFRNYRGASSIAPYSLRSRKGAPIAVPLAWRELKSLKAFNTFTVKNIFERLDALRTDPWKGYGQRRQKLPTMKHTGKLTARFDA